MQVKNYYEILGIRPTASAEEIALAYKGRRTQYHPDKYVNADEETMRWATASMQEVNEAYTALSDVNRRNEYDAIYQKRESNRQSERKPDGEEFSDSQSSAEETSLLEELKNAEESADAILKEFSAIPMIKLMPATNWKSVPVNPNPLPPQIQELPKKEKAKRRSTVLLFFLGAVMVILFAHAYISWIVLISSSIFLITLKPNPKEEEERNKRLEILKMAKNEYDMEAANWNSNATGQSIIDCHKHIIKTTKDYLSFISKINNEVMKLFKSFIATDMNHYLENILIRESDIPSIGSSRKKVLISHGICSAADIKRSNFFGRDGNKIPNIGESVFEDLLTWRKCCEAEYKPNTSDQGLNHDFGAIKIKFFARKEIFATDIKNSGNDFRQKINNVQEQRKNLLDQMQQAARRMAQADKDFRLVGTGKPLSTVVIVAVWIVAGGIGANTLFTPADHSVQTALQTARPLSSVASHVASPTATASIKTVGHNDNDATELVNAPPNATTTSTVEQSGICLGLDLSMTPLACLDKKFAQADKQLNDTYKQVMGSLDVPEKAALEKEQMAWIKEKEAKCAKVGQDSQLEAVQISDCKIQMTEQRVSYLSNFKISPSADQPPPSAETSPAAQVSPPSAELPAANVPGAPSSVAVAVPPEAAPPPVGATPVAKHRAPVAPESEGSLVDWANK